MWWLGCICCVWIAYEDIRSREISLVPLLLFGASGLGYQYMQADVGWQFQVLTNVGAMLFLLSVVWVLYWMKYRRNVLDVGLGWGDVFIFFGLACWYLSMEFMLFFSVNMCVWATLFSILLLRKKISEEYPIPLAGLLAIGFILNEWGKLSWMYLW
ncbi:MAG: prepilin peptidase [Bacteroidota bacterium]